MDPEFEDLMEQQDGFDAAFDLMPVFVGVFVLLFVAAVVFTIVVSVRKARRYREAGIDPLTADVEHDIRVLRLLEHRGGPPAPLRAVGTPTLEQRLDELDRLHHAGRITSAEREAARAKLLGNL